MEKHCIQRERSEKWKRMGERGKGEASKDKNHVNKHLRSWTVGHKFQPKIQSERATDEGW